MSRAIAAISFFCVLIPVLIYGQYAVDWHTMDGGGGISAGGGYTVRATTGQPDTGTSAEGGYELISGYWHPIVLLQTHGAPTLRMTWQTGLSTHLTWNREGSDGYRLQYSDSLTSPQWTDEPGAPQEAGDEWRVTISASANKRFFRLMRP